MIELEIDKQDRRAAYTERVWHAPVLIPLGGRLLLGVQVGHVEEAAELSVGQGLPGTDDLLLPFQLIQQPTQGGDAEFALAAELEGGEGLVATTSVDEQLPDPGFTLVLALL